jgi:hypothetical protein
MAQDEARSNWSYDLQGALVVVATVGWIFFGLASSGEDELPSCTDVWEVGDTLPSDYSGCEYPSGAADEGGVTCADGEVMFDYRNELHAVADAVIQDGYAEAYQDCLGG